MTMTMILLVCKTKDFTIEGDIILVRLGQDLKERFDFIKISLYFEKIKYENTRTDAAISISLSLYICKFTSHSLSLGRNPKLKIFFSSMTVYMP